MEHKNFVAVLPQRLGKDSKPVKALSSKCVIKYHLDAGCNEILIFTKEEFQKIVGEVWGVN